MSGYKSLKNDSTGEIRDRGSRFFAFARQIKNEMDADVFLNEIRQQHPKASHYCYAYKLIQNNGSYRVSDDREPANTAGMPILKQIEKFGLHNTMIVVVRYFGGTLLGKGGLIKAYAGAAEQSLLNANIIEIEEIALAQITFQSEDYHHMMEFLKKNKVKIKNQLFDRNWTVEIEYSKDLEEIILAKIKRMPSGNILPL
jgi:uncharacterized YigZ family protein